MEKLLKYLLQVQKFPMQFGDIYNWCIYLNFSIIIFKFFKEERREKSKLFLILKFLVPKFCKDLNSRHFQSSERHIEKKTTREK